MGDLFPTFVTSGSVEDLKRRVDPSMRSTDADVRACAGLSPQEKSSWAQFFESWNVYRTQEAGFWTAKAEYATGQKYESDLAAWQERLAAKCSLSSPRVVPQTQGEATSSEIVTAVKWIAAAALVAGVAYGVRAVLR